MAKSIGQSEFSYATMLSILTDCEDQDSLTSLLEQVEGNRERAEGERFYQNFSKLHYFLPDEDGNIQVFDVEGSYFHDCLMLLPSMITDHQMASYQQAFDSI